ncbi:NAD-dependent epimerase/dehydratase family protein [Georgenia subflava]|uniref:NAD-dependent epimerase/dehydratase family protein n=1 Tax=Georgenia subflava TaxID=1622177 RepID=A0A6N7EG23_9MICO|nr:NAD-dependent epimerase/dehydratase family protein [Georgenia subflava]MPV36980.1 NAD-dependent epimerase/dehydratase family protein [Georgenia subflava]
MRVVVVGGSGNAGTAIMRALANEPAITSVVGLARREPDTDEPPYDVADWVDLDVGEQTQDDADEESLLTRLIDALRGADAVIHLAWLIQPNHERDIMRRTNVDGTARVAEACARAGVPHLVVASSVGAYTPVDDDIPRDETWSTTGVPTSHYSVDKADQERVLDAFEAAHPDVTVARVRPALIFQDDAGAEIVRYFVGALVPPALLRPGRLPVLPLPTGLRLQVVHADDIADAYLRVVLRRASGAFNVATDPVLTGPDLARIADHGRLVEIPPKALRPLLSLAWQGRLVPTDPGWLDMGMGAPLMDTTRARTELGWAPVHDAEETLRELMEGMAAGAGHASGPMRPRRRWPADAAPPSYDEDSIPGGAHVPATIERDLLGLYLSDHLTGATAGLSRVRRMAQAYADTSLAPDLERLARDIAAERELLEQLFTTLGLHRRPHRQAAAWVGEHVGRLKLNGRLTSRSPMSVQLEIELMRSAVVGKLGVWQTLTELAPELGLPRERFAALADQAREHAAVLDRLHEQVRGATFRVDRQIE